MLDRRQLLTAVGGGLLGSLVLPRRSTALQASTAQQPGLIPLTDRLSVVTSGGTNVLALSTADGLVLVDSGAPDLSDTLMASLRQLPSGGRVRTVFNTHWHPENTGANDVLRQGGATIVAHENTRLWMATPTWMPAADRYRVPRPQAAHPNQTIRVDGSMNALGERIDYGYLIEAHTSGDIYVFFRESNVVAVGDVASPARDPELDYFTGAWIGGRVDAMDRLLALGDEKTRIVPGYGPVMSRADLRVERDMMKAVYDRSVDRVRESDTAEDMLKSGVLNGLVRTWKDPRRFLYDVQKGLWAHHNKLNPNVV
jgi:glyoxylase-like metal-dependent hydrolase (beta-lactamase superfamily II)